MIYLIHFNDINIRGIYMNVVVYLPKTEKGLEILNKKITYQHAKIVAEKIFKSKYSDEDKEKILKAVCDKYIQTL